MGRRLGISMVILAAAGVITVGVASFACGGKTASSNHVCNTVNVGQTLCPASGGCSMSRCQFMQQQENGACCDLQMAWGHGASKASYSANVIEMRGDYVYAVCRGKVFEVTDGTPFADLDDARYFLTDRCSVAAFQANPTASADELNQEAVSLATEDGNVVGNENGQKFAKCPVTGRVFPVTAGSYVKVMDGKCYYMSDTVSLSTLDCRYP